jgi:hypothetical protein
MTTVLFLDGTCGCYQVYLYQGACLVGQSTAYVYRGGKLTWVKPGESVAFVEVAD